MVGVSSLGDVVLILVVSDLGGSLGVSGGSLSSLVRRRIDLELLRWP